MYDYTNGLGGSHPLGVPLFLVTHRPPQGWPVPSAPFTAVRKGWPRRSRRRGTLRAARRSRWARPFHRIEQALDLDLVDEIAVELAPVLLGKGIRFFGELAHAPAYFPAVPVDHSAAPDAL